ncbi:hypothetical protein HPP92_005216 [Vanilla planifolia]|uniref:Uncharacterized protein n=1 Tax=Vanilla planifolia TaxID=51239 RepID=A0A835RZ26_VANPL|nr:hypothetical protein HPP92_005512 [Vanilla planifolia]KAG0494222.1 hypothetical protein HPP92_005216 [Vanilla planifolia]
MEANSKGDTASVWDCGSPLYDSFELTSLFHAFERHMVRFPFPSTTKGSASAGVEQSGDRSGKTKRKKKKKMVLKWCVAVRLPMALRAMAFWKKPTRK